MDVSTVLSRIHFAFTIGFHYLFPQLTMGLALFLMILKILYMHKKDEKYAIALRFWGKIFAVTFIMGVVTGIPMEFQFGTNWSRFSIYAGNLIAPMLAMEGAFAFFLESAFLGIFLFGEQTFGQKLHLIATIMLWLGTWSSGYFVVAANAWMQHPVGYTVHNSSLQLRDLWALLFNPWLFAQYTHTMSGAVVTAAFFMAGLGAYYLLAGQQIEYGRIFVTLGVIVGFTASAFQLWPSGDLSGSQVARYQPATLAAMEGLFNTEAGAGIVILGQPDVANSKLDNPLIVPNALSILTYRRWSATVEGLNAFPPDQRPDSISALYYAYHIMVGLGTFFLGIMALALLLFWRKRQLFERRWMLWILMLATPFPFIANTAGWFTAELGRQPWVVFGMMRTNTGSSLVVSSGNVIFTLLGFLGSYLLLGLLYVLLIVHEGLRGPAPQLLGQEEDHSLLGY
ncbi:MAG: cytochrome ubiquinol oxidase subunit I [Ktedonobacteraceae bacterium]